MHLPLCQGITLSDGVTVVSERGRNISQPLSIAATTSIEVSVSRPVTQGITISDGVTATLGEEKAAAVEETILLSDVVTVVIIRGKAGVGVGVSPRKYTGVISETLAVSDNIKVDLIKADSNGVVINIAAIGETLAVSDNIKVDFTAKKAPINPLLYVGLPIFCALIVLLVLARFKIALFIEDIINRIKH